MKQFALLFEKKQYDAVLLLGDRYEILKSLTATFPSTRYHSIGEIPSPGRFVVRFCVVSAIRNVELALGDGRKEPAGSELANLAVARKSIVAACGIKKGEEFTTQNLTTKRPGDGISPRVWSEYPTWHPKVSRSVSIAFKFTSWYGVGYWVVQCSNVISPAWFLFKTSSASLTSCKTHIPVDMIIGSPVLATRSK